MTRAWPDGEDLLTLIGQSTGPHTRVRDGSILVAAAHRPHAALLEALCHKKPLDQAASLLHAIMVWEPLEMWNSGLAWAATRVFLERYDRPLDMPAKDRMELTDDIVTGRVTEVRQIAERLEPYLRTR